MDELISRQAAIDELHGKDPSQIWDTADIEVWVNGLPSVQPETHDKRTETHACDLINRQDAIDAIRKDMYADKDYISALICDGIEDVLKSLPPAQPEHKTGRWIDAVLPNDNGGLPVQVCDQCNTFFPLAYTGGGHHFCPNCGAKMEVEHE